MCYFWLDTAAPLSVKTGSGTQFIDPHLLATSTLNLRSDPFLRWLHHTGVPLARPGLLLVALSALLLTTLRFMCVMLVDGVVDSQPGAWHTAESGCCPGQTGHHLLPNEMFQDCPQYTSHMHDAAPTVCVEGVNNSHGSHGKIHDEMDELMKNRAKKDNQIISNNDAIEDAVKSQQKTFPGCDPKCLAQQLHAYYDGLCEGKLKPRGGKGGQDNDAGDAEGP